jgi:Icc-related predicted phosphoesterase
MRLCLISDTHTKHRELGALPECDVLIHAGDSTWTGELDKLEDFAKWMGDQPARHILAIAGNHDWCFQHTPELARRTLAAYGVHYLQDESVTIDGFKFYGSPWQPEFNNWAFNLPRGGPELVAKWAAIPHDTDVLITHGPPLGILDACPGHVGCRALLKRVESLPKLKLHVFGHIHGGYGSEFHDGLMFVNASSCTGSYRCSNRPVIVDL